MFCKKYCCALILGLGWFVAVSAVPEDDTVLEQETNEFLKHCMSYSKVAGPTAVQFTLPYLAARADLHNVSRNGEKAAFEAIGSVVVWQYLKKYFCKVTALNADSVPCDPAVYAEGSRKRQAAEVLNTIVRGGYVVLDFAGPMLLRNLVAGNVNGQDERHRQ